MDEFHKMFDPQKHALATDSEGTSLLMHIIWVMNEWQNMKYLVNGLNAMLDYTPLLSVCDDLLNHGADVNEKVHGTSLLGHCLSSMDELKPDLVHLLLRHGATVQCCNWGGESVLKWLLETQTFESAYDERRTRVLQLLLEFGANANEFLSYGTVPLDLDENPQWYHLHENIRALLRKHGGLTGGEHRRNGRVLQAVKYHQPPRVPAHLYKYILSFAFHDEKFYDEMGVPAFWNDLYFKTKYISDSMALQKIKDANMTENPDHRYRNIRVPKGIIRHLNHCWGWYPENAAAILDDPTQLARLDYRLKLL